MRTLYLCGAGNSEAVRLALSVNRRLARWSRLVLLDDDPRKLGWTKLGVQVTGPLSDLSAADPSCSEAVNLVARTTAGRRAVRERIRSSGVPMVSLIAAGVDLEGAEVAADVMIYANATVGPEVSIGEGSVAFMGAVLGHEAVIGAGCVIASNAVLNARVTLGEGVYVGSCATIVPEVHVGAWATIGAGSLVVEDVPDGATVVGVPAEVVVCRPEPAPVTSDAARGAETAAGGAPPATTAVELERVVLGIWRELLNVSELGRDDNFFDLGGCSLRALQMRARVREATGLDMAMTDVFRFPSVRALAEHLGRTPDRTPDAGLARARARRAAMNLGTRGVQGR